MDSIVFLPKWPAISTEDSLSEWRSMVFDITEHLSQLNDWTKMDIVRRFARVMFDVLDLVAHVNANPYMENKQ